MAYPADSHSTSPFIDLYSFLIPSAGVTVCRKDPARGKFKSDSIIY